MSEMYNDRIFRISERFHSNINRLEDNDELWNYEWSVILNEVNLINNKLIDEEVDYSIILSELDSLLDRARDLNSKIGS